MVVKERVKVSRKGDERDDCKRVKCMSCLRKFIEISGKTKI